LKETAWSCVFEWSISSCVSGLPLKRSGDGSEKPQARGMPFSLGHRESLAACMSNSVSQGSILQECPARCDLIRSFWHIIAMFRYTRCTRVHEDRAGLASRTCLTNAFPNLDYQIRNAKQTLREIALDLPCTSQLPSYAPGGSSRGSAGTYEEM
jgi:hypothetical protein